MTDNDLGDPSSLRAALNELRAQLEAVDRRLQALEGPAEAPPLREAPEPAAEIPVAKPLPRRRPPLVRPPRRPRAPNPLVTHFKTFFTEGNPLNKFGAGMLIIGVSILFKYAVDNDWIGPTGRVGIGLLAGLALFAAGEYYQRRGWGRFASGLVAAGQGVLFVSVFFGHRQYGVVPPAVAFSLYVLFTATVVAQSLRYNAMALATWGLLGGYLTPAIASTGSGNFVFLSTYLLVLNTGVLAVAFHRTWQPLKWMAFLLTEPYVLLWVLAYLEDPHSTRWLEFHWLLPYLWVFFAYFAAIPVWRSLFRREPIDRFGQILTVLNGVVHFTYAALLLYDDHRAWLGVVAVVVTALYAAISSSVTRQPVLDTRALTVFSGTAAGFLVLATPFLAWGPAITLCWCAETVFLAWVCTQPRFAFLRFHVLAMIAVILVRLVGYDRLLAPAWAHGDERYIPLTHLRSYPPLAAAATFALVARLLGRVPNLRLPLGPVLAVGLIVLTTGLDGEAFRTARHLLVPGASAGLVTLLQAGLLVALLTGLWFAVLAPLGRGEMPWGALLGFTVVLTVWVAEAVLWPVPYRRMTRILDPGLGLWWLHGAVLMLASLVLLFARLYRTAPERAVGLSREQLQMLCFAAAIVVTLFLLRREIFAITHAPPFDALFPESARRASYRMLLSLSYALLAFGIYLSAVLANHRPRLFAAYALYILTAVKVILFDIASTNQLYRGFSVLIVGAILILSHYFAQRQRARHAH